MEMLGGLIIAIGFSAALGYLPLQIIALVKWRGAWRWAAVAPLALMVPVIVYTAYAFAQDSNLWPIVLIFAAPIATFGLGILFVIHYVTTRQPNVAGPV
jgi:hypothetical protein